MKIKILTCLLCAFMTSTALAALNTKQIEQLTGVIGQYNNVEHYFKLYIPRDDLKIVANGVKITPAMGLASWIIFKGTKDNNAIMSGDLVLTEDQVNIVLMTALQNNLRATSLHSRFLWESPRVMFLHIEGEGKANVLALAVHKVLTKMDATSGGNGSFPIAEIDPINTSFRPATIDTILGLKGTMREGVYKIIIGKKSNLESNSFSNNNLGLNSWAAFAGAEDAAVVDGDIVMHESDLENVIKVFDKANINIVAIHQQITDEPTQIISLHYWGIGNLHTLAKAVRTSLDLTKEKYMNNKLFGLAKSCPIVFIDGETLLSFLKIKTVKITLPISKSKETSNNDAELLTFR